MASLPNLLTGLRILLAPLVVLFVLNGRCGAALPLCMFAGATDGVDGYLARRFGWTSRLGAYLDPIADKFLLTSLYVSLAVADLVPDWLVWLVVGRDVVILAMTAAGLALTSVRDYPPSVWGKLSTVVQISASIVFLAACAGLPYAPALSRIAVPVVAAATFWSGLHYIWRAVLTVRHQREIV